MNLRDIDVVRLTEAGLLTRDLPQSRTSPWMLKLLLGGAAWFAAIFVIAFVALLFEPDTPIEAGILGIVLLGGAFALFLGSKSLFVEQVALAASMAGQGFLLFAAYEAIKFDTIRSATFVACAIQIGVFLLLPNHLSRLLSAFFAALAWSLAWRSNWIDGYGPGPGGFIGILDWLYGVLPLMALVAALLFNERRWLATSLQSWLLPATISLIAALCVAPIVMLPFERSSLFGGGSIGLALWPLLSLATALCALAAARYLAHPALMALAIVSAIFSVIAFYYELSIPLLAKSLLMLALAAIAFATHGVLRKKGVA